LYEVAVGRENRSEIKHTPQSGQRARQINKQNDVVFTVPSASSTVDAYVAAPLKVPISTMSSTLKTVSHARVPRRRIPVKKPAWERANAIPRTPEPKIELIALAIVSGKLVVP
jgi:hypothetical protein